MDPFTGRSRGFRIFFGFLGFFLPTLLDELVARLPGPEGDKARVLQRGPDRLFLYLQGLAGSFVKFGQLMSMRYDLLPVRYCRSLEQLYDRVPPFPSETARAIVEAELGRPIDELFHRFDDVPIGAASFGQIHRVVLALGPDAGAEAVVKVQRPGATDHFKRDSRWLLVLGWLIDSSSVLGQVKLSAVFRDFVRWTRRELDFTQEAKNADRVYEETEWNTHQRIPWIYWDFTTRRVLTMEYLEGLPISEIIRRLESGDPDLDDDLDAIGCDRQTLATTILHNHHLQAFVGQVFHADPHPGNLIVLPDNVVGYVDFGLMGRMNPEGHRELMALMDAVATRDVERLFVAVLDLLDAPRGLMVTSHYEVFYEAVDTWLDNSDNPGASPLDKSITNLIVASMDVARRIGLPLSMDAILYFKALMSVDAGVLRMNPQQDYHRELQQTLRVMRLRMIDRRLEPNQTLDRVLNATLMALTVPDFVKEQLILYQQTSQAMHRRINQFPLMVAGLLRSTALLLVLCGLVLLPFDFGYASHLPTSLVEGAHLDVLETVGAGWIAFFVAGFGMWWMARVVAAQSLVKVQGGD